MRRAAGRETPVQFGVTWPQAVTVVVARRGVLPDQLRSARVGKNQLQAQLRQAGIRRYDDVACVILERTGSVSVLRRGERRSAPGRSPTCAAGTPVSPRLIDLATDA